MNKDNLIEILLVEDNPSDAELTILALQENKLSNHIVWLKNGREALDFLFGQGQFENRNTSNQPKVVLLDLKMPKINGLEVLEQMRKNTITRKIPVVVLTSSNEDKDIVESYELGVNSYIVKPVDFEKFNNSVRDIGYYWLLINKIP